MKKETLRLIFLERRNQIIKEQRIEESEILFSKIIQLMNSNKPKIIHTYLPQEASSEPNTFRLIEKISEKFPMIQIVVPCVVPKSKKLKHFLLEGKTDLILNRWKIPEPNAKTAIPVLPNELDMVIVPLLAFDKNGFRVGYGGGYYDRFLADCKPQTLKVGISFFEPIDAISDINKFDIKLDLYVTPYHIYNSINEGIEP